MSEECMYYKFLIFSSKVNMACKHLVNLYGIIILLKWELFIQEEAVATTGQLRLCTM